MPGVTAPQLCLLFTAIALFAAGEVLSLARIWWEQRSSLRVASKACLYLGTLVGLGALVWHALARGSWRPLEDNFDAMVWLALLLALFVLYIQRTHPLRGLDWFILPIVVLLLTFAAVFGRTKPHEYSVASVWALVHRVTAYGGAAAFAVAGAVGAMYLIASRRLRNKMAPGPNLGSLERLEHLTLVSVTLGFSLLTIGAVTGGLMLEEGKRAPLPKIVLAATVWIVYAIVLHSPINPSFRGRKAAVLSVIGFVLMVGTIIAVQLLPSH